MKQVMNCHKDNGLLNMIRRTDPMINLHYKGKKYFYNGKDKTFSGAPQKANDLLKREDVQNAISKGLKYLGE